MSAFRPIRPSSTTLPPSEAQHPSEGSTRQGESGDDQPPGNVGKGRKRKAPTQVNQNACTNCKKARSRCDGNEPEPCSRCISRDVGEQCRYEVHVKTIKEDMVRKIKNLEQQNAELLGSVKEKDHQIDAIFEALKNNDRGPEALARLRSGQSYEDLVGWLGTPPYSDVSQLSPSSEIKLADIVNEYENSMRLDSESQSPEAESRVHWTMVMTDDRLIHHLMALYFTWVHPVHMLFGEKHFLESFRSGDRTYCSPALLNAMCAMGCFYLVEQGGNDNPPKVMRKRFFDRALVEVAREDPKALTFASTYAMLFLVELSSNQARKATSHLRLAVECLNGLDTSVYSPVAVELASWGIHALSTTWAALTYQKPHAPLSSYSKRSNTVPGDAPDALWQAYRVPQDNSTPQIPSCAIATSKEMTKLAQIVHETVAVSCGSKGSVTAQSVVYLYRRYLEWKNSLPSALTIFREGADIPHPLPHVLFLHIKYQVALCQLFRPLLDIAEFPAATRAHLFNITIQSAQDGLKMLERYRSLYTTRYQSPLLSFCVVHLCETIMRGGASVGDKRHYAVQFALEATHEALPAFAHVGPLQYMFCQAVADQGLALPKDVRRLMGGRREYGPEELLDACERVTYTQPCNMFRDRADQSLGVDFEREWKQFIEAHGTGGNHSVLGNRPASREASLEERRSSSNSSAGGSSARSMQINSVVNPQ